MKQELYKIADFTKVVRDNFKSGPRGLRKPSSLQSCEVPSFLSQTLKIYQGKIIFYSKYIETHLCVFFDVP